MTWPNVTLSEIFNLFSKNTVEKKSPYKRVYHAKWMGRLFDLILYASLSYVGMCQLLLKMKSGYKYH